MAYTHTCSPYNSTPFSSCCGVACIDWSGKPATNCVKCGESLAYHASGASARRQEVGRGNCLVCGSPRGNPAVPGNCNC